MEKLFYDDEDIIGISEDIAEYLIKGLKGLLYDTSLEDDEKESMIEVSCDALKQLIYCDDDLVRLEHCVMDGSYTVYKYKKEEE